MAYFTPTPLEISAIEQIETAHMDPTLSTGKREELMVKLWTRLEAAHGAKILSVTSPEGEIIQRPAIKAR